MPADGASRSIGVKRGKLYPEQGRIGGRNPTPGNRRRGRGALPSPRVGRMSRRATDGLDGWPSPRLRKDRGTELGLQIASLTRTQNSWTKQALRPIVGGRPAHFPAHRLARSAMSSIAGSVLPRAVSIRRRLPWLAWGQVGVHLEGRSVVAVPENLGDDRELAPRQPLFLRARVGILKACRID